MHVQILLFVVSVFALFYSFSLQSYGQVDSSGHGVYIINPVRGTFLPPVLNASYVRGLSARDRWSTAEPAEGHYNWNYLDGVFQTAARYNKKVIFSVYPGVSSPDWIYQAGVQRVQRGRESMPVPWDPIYLAKWTNFVRVLGNRYNSNPSLYAVNVGGPTFGSIEFYLPGTERDWRPYGYTPVKLLNAWKQSIDAFAKAFPDKAIILNVHPHILGNRELPEQIVEYGLNTYGRRVFIQGDWLSAYTPQERLDVFRQLSRRTTVGFEMLDAEGAARFGKLRTAIEKGLAGAASYLVIYQSDAINPNLSKDIQYAAAQLQIPPERRSSFPPEISQFQRADLSKGPENTTTVRRLTQQLRQARESALNRDFQTARAELQGAENTLNLLQEEYPQAKSQLLEARTKLDQTINSLNRRNFSQAQRSYQETLQILRAARRGVLPP